MKTNLLHNITKQIMETNDRRHSHKPSHHVNSISITNTDDHHMRNDHALGGHTTTPNTLYAIKPSRAARSEVSGRTNM